MTGAIGFSARRKAAILIGLTLSVFMAALDSTIVATSMKAIAEKLSGMDLYAWPMTVYLLCSTIITPLAGKWADTIGRKKAFMASAAVFVAGSVLCGISPSMVFLVVCRAIQGVGAGALMANTMAMVGDAFPPAERAKSSGIVYSAFALASVIGPVLGGLIADCLDWRWVFFINLPFGIAFMLLIGLAVPGRASGDVPREKADIAGVVSLTAGLIALLLALTLGGKWIPWISLPVIGLAIFAIVALLVFVSAEFRAENPILPLSFFGNRTFLCANAAAFLSNATMFGVVLFVPLYAQVCFGGSATNSGLSLAPMMIGFSVASLASGRLISKTGKMKFFGFAGFVTTSVGIGLLLVPAGSLASGLIPIAVTLCGIGIGMNLPVFTLAVQNEFPRGQMGVVTAAVQFSRSIGGTISSAFLGILMGIFMSVGMPISGALRLVFIATLGISLAAIVVAVLFPDRKE